MQPALLNQTSLSNSTKSCKHWICQEKMLKNVGNIDGGKVHLKDWKVFDRTDLGKVRKGYFNALTYIPLIVSYPLMSLWTAIVFLPSHNFGVVYSWHQHQGLMDGEVLIMTNDLPWLGWLGWVRWGAVVFCIHPSLFVCQPPPRQQLQLSIFCTSRYLPTCQKYLPTWCPSKLDKMMALFTITELRRRTRKLI